MTMTPPTAVVTRDSDQEDAATQATIEGVQNDLKIGPDIDPLEALLSIDQRPEDVQDSVTVAIVGGKRIKWTYRAMTGQEIDDIDELCTSWVRRGRGDKVRQRDTQRFTRMIVATATLSPNLDDQRLRDKFGAQDAERLVGRVLMPGTYDGVSTKILELSGYTDDLIGTAGN